MTKLFDKMNAALARGDGDAPQPEVRMSEGIAHRKTAYQIDPLLKRSLVIDQSASHGGRGTHEMTDASALHKHRRFDKQGRPYWKPLVIIAIVLVALVAQVPHQTTAHSGQRANQAASVNRADVLQLAAAKLTSYGYVTNTPARLDKAIRHWQRANGLIIDGIVGPQTLGSLGLAGATFATAPAVRLNPPAPPPAPDLTPALPVKSDDACAEMSAIRQNWGLPDIFDDLGWREGGCTNTPISSTGCCVGYWQIHKIVFSDHRIIPLAEACGATWFNIRGDDIDSKNRQACMAKALYDTVNLQPWR